MEAYISVFDMLKIGIGPSSSHTLGPWKAAASFMNKLKQEGVFFKTHRLEIKLYGSLSLTGKGHATDSALILGLLGYQPETIPVNKISGIINEVALSNTINLNGEKLIKFNPAENIIFLDTFLPFHSNAMRFTAFLEKEGAFSEAYYSIGGGFITTGKEDELSDNNIVKKNVPFKIATGDDLTNFINQEKCPISFLAEKNEIALGKSLSTIVQDLQNIWEIMLDSIFQGCITSGVLPGGLNVRRRAYNLALTLLEEPTKDKEEFFLCLRKITPSFAQTLDFINMFALAVNEVNASLGRVVTAPTNGSAGVIPSVLAFYLCFVNKRGGQKEISAFLLTAGLIGGIFKNGATISAAAGGCQAEIGVSSAMAAAALTEVLGGTPQEAMMAAEIAMEHHLGLTCDPVNGLVQVPCIERNAMGALKAINAANLALKTSVSAAVVSLQNIIDVMNQTAQDMNIKYKETSQGGLAAHISVREPSC